jgi:hypothetical protein
MLIDLPHLFIETEQRRAALLAEAESFRLSRLARAARRVRSRREKPPGAPPGSSDAADTVADRPRRNDDAERRYAVSR